MRMLNIVLAACLLLTPVRAEGQDAAGLSPDDVSKINEVSRIFSAAVFSRDWAALSALFLDDAVLYPYDSAPLQGRAAIEAALIDFPEVADFKLSSIRVEGRGDLAYVEGAYEMTVSSPEGVDVSSGHYLQIHRRRPNGQWLIAVHMYTSD